MRITGNRRDYYDGLQDYVDKTRFNKVWNRIEVRIPIEKSKLKVFEDHHIRIRTEGWASSYMIIAGKVIPFIFKRESAYGDSNRTAYFTTEDTLKAYEPDYKKACKYAKRFKRYWDFPTELTKKELDHFFSLGVLAKNYTDLHIEVGSPIILLDVWNRHNYRNTNKFGDETILRNVIKDANLKRNGFHRRFNIYDMFQTLDQFVTGVLINDDMPTTTPMTEKEKMDQHGFTHKYSFRKEPGKKRGKK